MLYIDANIILRYILDDHAQLSPMARKIIGENIVGTPIEVLCEVVYVLTKTYGIKRKDIAATLLDFYESTNAVLPHKEAVLKGIEYFGEKSLDFVDCIFAGYYEKENITVQTFDENLNKLLNIITEAKN